MPSLAITGERAEQNITTSITGASHDEGAKGGGLETIRRQTYFLCYIHLTAQARVIIIDGKEEELCVRLFDDARRILGNEQQ